MASFDDIVISGIAGRFPASRNMQELWINLMEKRDMVSDDDRRWTKDITSAPHRTGKVDDITKFDAHYFGIQPKQVHAMEPMSRMLLEHTYEAIVDAGINPKQLRGTKTGVFVGTCFSDSENKWMYGNTGHSSLGVIGCARAMYANRISYWLNASGLSFTLDTGCSSSLTAMEQGYRSIKDGICDAAIVAASNLCLLPDIPTHFNRLGVLAQDGRCKTWDKAADGFVRSEAVCVVFLQRAKDAKRVYAKVLHSKVNCDGYKEEGIMFPSSHMQSQLFREIYEECGVPSSRVDFVEAHGTGTRAGDSQELASIDRVFGRGRTSRSPLLIGSVKTNLGHTEPVSGLVAVAKVLLAMESSIIPPNINFKECKPELTPIIEGRIKVVVEPTSWEGPYAAVNNFGFGGVNAHVLLERNAKGKTNNGSPSDNLPRLVAVSGRTEEAVNTVLQYLESRPVDVEFVGLLHNIHSDEITGHLYRGYTLLPSRGIASCPIKEVKPFVNTKRPVWFVFSGMGSQWPGMGKALLHLPVFAEAVKRCDAALKPHGIDIFDVISNEDESNFGGILNWFVGIVAVQIGLVDVLKSLGIEPDNIIGHSFGELASSYADGSLTAEQTILSAYYRGLVSVEMKTSLIRGAMAAVGLGHERIKDMCPPDVYVACHNSAESATISGPADSVEEFIAELAAKRIFAEKVQVWDIAYHSRYIAALGPRLHAYLKKVIPKAMPRSSKWVSSSVPMSRWDEKLAGHSSAEYHTNNLLSPVLFEEASSLIPNDAIAIEIAPRGLLQGILRRSLAPTVTSIPLMQRGHEDNVEVLFQAIGKMFNEGLQPRLDKLYPAVAFPVSRGTAMIAPLIKWDHTQDWFTMSHKADGMGSGERNVMIDLTEDKRYKVMLDHIVDGRNLFPASGYLTLIWETYGAMIGKQHTECSVVFEDVKFLRATTIPRNGLIKFRLMIQLGTGRFEIVEGSTAVVTGFIRGTSHPEEERIKCRTSSIDDGQLMTSRDVYKELRLRGYQYAGTFRSITRAATSGAKAHVRWHDWITFLDNVMQLKVLAIDARSLFVPTAIKKILIDTKAHYQQIPKDAAEPEIEVTSDELHDLISSDGVQICGFSINSIARKKPARDAIVEEHKFVPFCDGESVSLREIARLATHIAVENSSDVKVRAVELVDETDHVSLDNLLSPWISKSWEDLPLIQAEITIITTKSDFELGALPDNVSLMNPSHFTKDATALLVVGHQLLADSRSQNLKSLLSSLKPGGFLLSRESHDAEDVEFAAHRAGLCVILMKKVANETLVLLRVAKDVGQKAIIVNVTNREFDWVETMRRALTKELEKRTTDKSRIFLVGQEDFENGLLGLVNCLRKEPGGELVRGILIQDPEAPPFSLENPIYASQVQKDLTMCVLRKNGLWGSYRHLPLPTIEPVPVQHSLVKQLTRGDLSSLTWMQGPIIPENEKDLVHIIYAPLNFKDVMLGSGKLALEVFEKTRHTEDYGIGFEYSGIDNTNKRIMGVLERCAMSNLCIPHRDLAWDVPDNWSLEDAATVPVAYVTCIYAFYMKSRIRKGHKILIHAGAGAVGQAAINLALAEGCEVFTTVGTPQKRKFIRDNFPQIQDDHIGNSRDTSFEQMVKERTDGYGVDFVLNSLSEEKLLASVRCVARNGHYFEIGSFDTSADNPLGMSCFRRGITFHGLVASALPRESQEIQSQVKSLFEKYLKSGAIKPLVRTVFSKDQVEAALRYLAGSKHIGKVLIKVRETNDPIDTKIPAIPQYYCLENRSYIILGGLGGFGMELADWLVLKGAKNLVITSRKGIKNGYQKMRIDLWKSHGVNVSIVSDRDASSQEDCRHIIETAVNLAPVDGIFNLAVLLKDALWENQTAENFQASFRPKAKATKNLDTLTRQMCPELRHFVVFSSLACGYGNAGQSNYAMSNSSMERTCEKRVSERLPGLAIQWGAIGDVGLVAEMQEDSDEELVIGGTLQQRISSCLRELEGFLHLSRPIVASMVVAKKKDEGGEALNAVDAVLNIMGLKDLNGISPNATLSEMGMDSLMAVEVKQALERNHEIFLNTQDVRNLTFAKLQEMSNTQIVHKAASGTSAFEEMKMLIRIAKDMIKMQQDTYHKLQTKDEMERDEIFMFPGIEGLSYVYANLSSKLKAPATSLQLGVRSKFETIADMAGFFLHHVHDKCKVRSTFSLVGYSFGALLALETARQLEEKQLQGRVILIDGAPEPLKTFLTRGMSVTAEDLENHTFAFISQMIASPNTAKFIAYVPKCKNWNEKLELFVQSFSASSFGLNDDELKDYCTSMYKRILAAVTYNRAQSKPMRCPITLIRPTSQSFKSTSEDYGLSKLTTGPIDVHYVTGDHITILDNDEVANIINEIK